MKVAKNLLAIGAVVVLCAVSGAIGGAIGPDAQKDSYNISYADFIVIMLTSVAVLVTVLAVVMAILAFVGWQNFEMRVNSAAREYIKSGFEPDQWLHKLFIDQKDKASVTGAQPVTPSFEKDAAEEGRTEQEY
ncbi:MAG: hypothetical protein PSV22_06300 [Pseudolabrys sp.]|nr:hypothetical protein [Pseudolabrys sp.]